MPRWRRPAAALALAALLATGCSQEHGSRQAFCTQVAKVPPLSGVLTGYTDADPTELARRLATTRTAYDDLRDAAPSAIDSETDAMVELVDEILDAVEQHADDPTAVQTALRATMASHGDAGPGATKVAAYASDRCGVELDPTGVTSTTAG